METLAAAARHAAANVMRSGVVQATSPAMPVMRAEAAAAFSTVQRAHHAALVGFQAAPMWALGSSKNPRAAVTALRSFHAAPVLFSAQGSTGNDHPQVTNWAMPQVRVIKLSQYNPPRVTKLSQHNTTRLVWPWPGLASQVSTHYPQSHRTSCEPAL